MTTTVSINATHVVIAEEDGRISPVDPTTSSPLLLAAIAGRLDSVKKLVQEGAVDHAAWLRASPHATLETLMALRQLHATLSTSGHPPPQRKVLDYVLLLSVQQDDTTGRSTLNHCLNQAGWNTHNGYLTDGPGKDTSTGKQTLLLSVLTTAINKGLLDLFKHIVSLTGGMAGLKQRLGPRNRELLSAAINCNQLTCLDYLLDEYEPTALSKQELTSLLFQSITTRQERVTRHLFARGVDMQHEENNQQAMDVLAAMRSPDIQMARFLLEHGARPEGAGRGWHTPAETALSEKNKELLDLLVAHGLRIDPVDQHPNGPIPLLVRAAAFGSAWALPTLLACGATIDEADGAGHTPLIAASLVGSQEMVKALLDAGADPRKTDNIGNHNALWHAASSGFLDIFLTLLDVCEEGLEATEAVAQGGVAAWWRRQRLDDISTDSSLNEDEPPRKL